MLKNDAFGLYDNEGRLVLNEGEYEIFIGTCQPDVRSVKLTGKKPYSKTMRSKNTIILQ
jgi:beta-glucosidase